MVTENVIKTWPRSSRYFSVLNMNRSILHTAGNDKVNSRLNVPSKSSDIRLVAETSEKPAAKRGGFRKMARDSKSTTNARPARRIKLNRSIFNTDSTAKPTFRVKTLSEIKTEKEAKKDDEKPVIPSTEESASVVVKVENVSSVCESSASPMPARSVNSSISSSVSADTRTVIKRENTTRLLLPTIQLKRIEHYSRNFHKQNKSPQNARTVVNKGAGQALPQEAQAVLTPSTQGSPVKKRKVGSTCLSISNPQVSSPSASPLKRRKISPIRSPDSQLTPAVNEGLALSSPSPLQPPSPPPENPLSPTLSLGAQSDDELSEMSTPMGNSRVIIMTESTTLSPKKPTNHNSRQYKNTKPVKTQNVHTRLGPPPDCQIQSTSLQSGTDDTLDVMVVDDDDDLFLEDKNLNGPLKRSLSQDSIFSMADESNNQGNLRTLAKKTHDTSRHSVGDLITSKPVSKSFKIPRQNSGRDTSNRNNGLRNSSESDSFSKIERSASRPSENHISGRTGRSRRNGFFSRHLSHPPPKPTRVVSQDGRSLNGFSVEEKVRRLWHNLCCKNIREAWSIIKELDDRKLAFDVRVLEETVKVCEQISSKGATPVLAEIILSVFGVFERRGALQPMTYILTILTLTRCGKFQQAFDKLKDMVKSRTFPFQEVLMHFVHDMNKCLRANPYWNIELLQYIKSFNFSNPTQVFNDCLSSLAAAPVEALQEITTSQLDSLIAMVCVPPNTHAAVQVQNIMDKHCIPMSDQAITKLLILFQDSKCTKQLLDFAHKKCTDKTFDIGTIFDDEQLNLRDVEAHIGDLLKAGVLPRDDVFHKFIDKASSQNEFTMIYDLFLKSSSVKLSITTLKKMVDALENWDENINASVEVYSNLRQAKTAAKNDTPPAVVNHFQKPLPAKSQSGVCYLFKDSGWCRFGDRCRFSHAVDVTSGLHSVAQNGGKQQRNHNERTQASVVATSANIPLVNGVGHTNAPQFPSFQRPSIVVPMFKPIKQNHTPVLRIPRPQAMPVRHPFANQFRPKSVTPTPRFASHNSHPCAPPLPMSKPPSPTNQPPPLPQNKPPSPMIKPPPPTDLPPPLMFQPVSFSRATTPNTNKVKLNRSFSWEPSNNPPPKLRQSPLLQFQQPSPGSDNNNNKVVSELQQRIQHGLTSKDWKAVYLCYVEMKTANGKTVQASDLKIFRSIFVKDLLGVGSNFCEFVDFIHKEKSSVKSSYSDSANLDTFDKYDVEFLGSLGVSLMEKCLVIKKYDKGYEILHSLHAHNVSYFDCGKNFGAYIRDIPPSAVAIIAVKLCIGMSQEDSLLGAIEVLRASNYAIPEKDSSPDNIEYRIKVLQQLFTLLLDEGNIAEAYEILQHLNASPNVLVPLYVKILNHYSSLDDFDQSFDVLAEMKEKDFDLNIPACHLLYEKFLKLCLRNEQDEEAIATLKEMELRAIMLNGDVWQEMLNSALIGKNEVLTNQLFRRCTNLGVYPESFSTDTPWLCQLGCGYSRLEVRLLIVRHLKQLHQHLVINTNGSLSLLDIRDFQIILFPRVSESDMNQRFDDGIETALHRNGLIVAKVLLEDLNPPLTISNQTQEQFHSKFIVEAMSLYRWFNANATEEDDCNDDDASSKASVETCLSFMTRMTEFE